MTGAEGRSENFILYGTEKADPAPVRLVAGRLTADLAGGNLRSIAYDGIEVLRAVSFLVRDRDWGTYDPGIDGLTVDQSKDGFTLRYTALCRGPEGTDLTISALISADESGRLAFEAEALSESGFETNRCGFCVLHPIVGVAGTSVTVEHVDGKVDHTVLPDLIEPWQPFKDMRAICHSVMPDVVAECRMEGDTFEMEDQRNWSDASYKTYVRPLALPWPYRILAGEPVRQKVLLTIDDRRISNLGTIAANAEPVRLSYGMGRGTMPDIGLIITPEEAKATLTAATMLADTGAQELLFHFDPLAGHGVATFADFAAIAEKHAGSSTLEIAVACRRTPTEELDEIAAMMRLANFKPDAIVVSPAVDRQSTPPGSVWPECPPLEEVYAAARSAFPDVRLGGGMLSYFTELNRKRVPPQQLDFISHCTNPIVHAADDLSVMQTLEALPFITRSVRAIYDDKPYRIGPSTIPMRQNPYGSRTMDNPDGSRIPMANRDPRHNALFAAAYALSYAARVTPAGPERLTLSALTGPFGLIAGAAEPVVEGGMRPLFHVVKGLADLAGAEWLECLSSDPGRVLALIARHSENGQTLWLANLTAEIQPIDLQALGGMPPAVTLFDRRLADEGPVTRSVEADWAAELMLPPLAVARLSWA